MSLKHSTLSGIMLALFAVIGTSLVAITFEGTKKQIAINEKESLLRSLNAVLPHDKHDNDLYHDSIEVQDDKLLGKKPITVYRARQQGKPVAALFSTSAPDGYGGPIKLLIGIYTDGSLAGVRVINHKETPGLGDEIELEKSDWILSFEQKSLGNPEKKGWGVKRDGGIFDQFTGATITPRAIVKAVKNTLLFFKQSQEILFTPAVIKEEKK